QLLLPRQVREPDDLAQIVTQHREVESWHLPFAGPSAGLGRLRMKDARPPKPARRVEQVLPAGQRLVVVPQPVHAIPEDEGLAERRLAIAEIDERLPGARLAPRGSAVGPTRRRAL